MPVAKNAIRVLNDKITKLKSENNAAMLQLYDSNINYYIIK